MAIKKTTVTNDTTKRGYNPPHQTKYPPPPPLVRKYELIPAGFLYLLFLFSLLLSACPDGGSTTYVDVPTYITNTVTNTDTISPSITNHSFTVAENIDIGTIIGVINANDNRAFIYYSITAGNPNYVFSINTNGELKSVMKLDHDTTSNYILTVRVSDAAGNTSNATVAVNVTDVDRPPTVTTLNANEIQNNSVILNGNINDLGINSDGNRSVHEYGFVYSTNILDATNLQLRRSGVEKIAMDNITSTGPYSLVIANLSPGTVHYFRAFAVNDGGTNYGEVSNFFTTYHQIFTLSGATNGEQTNLIHPSSTHTYNVFLSNTHSYNLTVNANSNISGNVSVYEGIRSNPLYIRSGPFSITAEGTLIANANIGHITTTFSGVSNGSRYLVLPLATTSHRLVISNSNAIAESYTLTLAEETGTVDNPIGRLLVDETTMGFFTNNEPELYWVHVPGDVDLLTIFPQVLNGKNCGVAGNTSLSTAILAFGGHTSRYESFINSHVGDTYEIVRVLNNDSNFDYRGCQIRFRFR